MGLEVHRALIITATAPYDEGSPFEELRAFIKTEEDQNAVEVGLCISEHGAMVNGLWTLFISPSGSNYGREIWLEHTNRLKKVKEKCEELRLRCVEVEFGETGDRIVTEVATDVGTFGDVTGW